MAGSAETARLIASLELKDNLSKGIGTATASIGKLEGKMNRLGGIAQKGVSSAITNVTRLGLAAGVAVAGAVGFGIRSLADLARTEAQTAAVIESTGGKAGVSAAQVREYAESLEKLSTVDDKVIQDGQNMLLTFTGISKDVFPEATRATLNMAVAMAGGNVEQVDMKASAIQLGKALNDPIKGITALRKVGVAFTEDQQKQIKALVKSGDTLGAQKIILKELEVEFGNAAEAAGKGPEASWRRLQDVGEDLSQTIARGLLPVLVRAADWLSTKLADPAVVKTIDDIGQALGKAGDEALKFIDTVDFKGIADSLGAAVGFAGGIVKAFAGMPDWIKQAVVTGWGLNKLTGGAVVDLGKLVVEQFAARGATPANPLFVADVTGGLGKGILPGAAGAAGAGVGGAALAGGGLLVASAAISAAAIMASPQFNRSLQLKDQAPTLNAAEIAAIKYYQGDEAYQRQVVLHLGKAPTKADFESGLAKLQKGTEIFGPPKPATSSTDSGGRGARSTFGEDAILARAIAKGFKPTDAAVQATLQRNIIREQEKTKAAVDAVKVQEGRTTAGVLLTAAAVQNMDRKPPTTNVFTTVTVTAANVKKSVVIQRRAGPAGGSRHRGGPQEF
jgi:hypothetical protein